MRCTAKTLGYVLESLVMTSSYFFGSPGLGASFFLKPSPLPRSNFLPPPAGFWANAGPARRIKVIRTMDRARITVTLIEKKDAPSCYAIVAEKMRAPD